MQQLAASKSKSQWRRNHEAFQAVCKGGRGSLGAAASERPPDGKIECPHCSRRFDENAADRHIPICAKVISRAKPPPAPACAQNSPNVRKSITVGSSPSTACTADSWSGSSSSAGAGTQAARSLRRTPSETRRQGDLPSAHSTAPGGFSRRPPPSPHSPKSRTSSRGRQAAAGRSPENSMSDIDPNATMRNPPGDDSNMTERRTSSAPRSSCRAASPRSGRQSPSSCSQPLQATAWQTGSAKIGLRRSAMLYRLLSQVPEDALVRELIDSGADVDVAGLAGDREAIIEAIIGELS